MQIIYTKTVGKHHFTEKKFYLTPQERVLIVLEPETTIKQMRNRSTYSTRACANRIIIVLVKRCGYLDSPTLIPKYTNVESFLVNWAVDFEAEDVPLKDFVLCESMSRLPHLISVYFT